MKINRIVIEPKATWLAPGPDNPLRVEVFVRFAEQAEIRMPLGPDASARLIAVMAKELVEATTSAAQLLTAHTIEAVTGQALLPTDEKAEEL